MQSAPRHQAGHSSGHDHAQTGPQQLTSATAADQHCDLPEMSMAAVELKAKVGGSRPPLTTTLSIIGEGSSFSACNRPPHADHLPPRDRDHADRVRPTRLELIESRTYDGRSQDLIYRPTLHV
jgi:hypothetical protein